jgi:sugar phosphate isomerase/epimerase|uniref:Sugar phosphate isomerase/epimerase n=1 Tax=Desulfobacca acetoxidans TaxID=60893 RepID=A0A7C5AK42_9BACT
MGISPEALVERVQVNIPFPFLLRGYLAKFLARGLNPEIGLDAGSLDTYPPAVFRQVAKAFQTAGRRLTLHTPFQDLAPGALDDLVLRASRQRLRQAFRWLPVFRPEAVVCHLGFEERHYRWDLENWLTRAAATFQELGRLAQGSGVQVMLENVYETDPELFQEILRRIALENVRICLDVGHLNAFGGGDFSRWLNTLGPLIGHLHLHDNQGSLDDHQALGSGTVPLAYVLTTLAGKGPPPLITLEPHQAGSLEPSLRCLAELWPWE